MQQKIIMQRKFKLFIRAGSDYSKLEQEKIICTAISFEQEDSSEEKEQQKVTEDAA